MIGKNVQGAGKANPNPMMHTHAGKSTPQLHNHAVRYTSNDAGKAQAAGAGKLKHNGQPKS